MSTAPVLDGHRMPLIAAVLLVTVLLALSSACGRAEPLPSQTPGQSRLSTYASDVAACLRSQWQVTHERFQDVKQAGPYVIGASSCLQFKSEKPGRPADILAWPDDEAARLEELAVATAALTPPANLSGRNRDLAMAFRLEARRWQRFPETKGTSGEVFWPQYDRWSRRSRQALSRQKRLIADWYFDFRVVSQKEQLSYPSMIDTFCGKAAGVFQ